MNTPSCGPVWAAYYPPGALAPLDVAGQRLTRLLDQAVHDFAGRTALRSAYQHWSYTELAGHARAMAALLTQAGVEPGARVAIMLPNMPAYVAAMFATWQVRATVVQINVAYAPAEIGRILEHSTPTVLITTSEQRTRLSQGGVDVTCALCMVDDAGGAGMHAASKPTIGLPHPDASPDIAVLQYTGGSTGLPKAVMLTHENILSNIEQRLRLTFRTLTVPPDAKIVNALPMCHVYGMTCVTLTGVACGMEQLIVPRFQTRQVLDLIRAERPFAFFGVPTMYAAFLRESDLESCGLELVSVFNSAGAPMPPAQLAQFEARVGARILDGFGMSEASPCTHTNPPFLARRAGSSGIPVPHTDVRIVAPDRVDLVDMAPGETGELAVRGPQVMRGYWGEPELTALTLRDGWLRSGDLANVDPEGFMTIVGRLKEIIVASGYNIYPAEIERVIAQVTGVAEVAVVGVADDYRGETVKAVVVAAPGATVNPDAVIARCRADLAPFKVPTVLEFRAELPRTAVGKIDRRSLVSPNPIKES